MDITTFTLYGLNSVMKIHAYFFKKSTGKLKQGNSDSSYTVGVNPLSFSAVCLSQ